MSRVKQAHREFRDAPHGPFTWPSDRIKDAYASMDKTYAKMKVLEAEAESFILYNRGSYTFRMLKEYLERAGVRLSSFMEISSQEAGKELIKVGMGVGLMADWAVEPEVRRGELQSLPLGRKKLMRTWGVSVRKGRKLNKAERIFIKTAEESGCHWMVNRKL